MTGDAAAADPPVTGGFPAPGAPGAPPPRPAAAVRPTARFGGHPGVRAALERRNADLAGFWLAPHRARARQDPGLAGRSVLIVDAEDTFTAMIAHQLRSVGLLVTVRRFDEPADLDGPDLVVLGPGPGDPQDSADPKIARLRRLIRALAGERKPFVAVCLSHQVLCRELGLALVRRPVPNQGTQQEIDLFGSPERVGFYNTFAASSGLDEIRWKDVGAVRVSRDPESSEVHALRGPGFASFQFHAESILTVGGVRIFTGAIGEALRTAGRTTLRR